MAKRKKFFVTNKDFEILHFLWKWKIVSTHALAAKFYPGVQPYAAYCRLLTLEKHKLIRCISFRHRSGNAWTLDTKGFQILLSYLPELSQNGYKAENVVHDYYATAFHLGEWLRNQPTSGAICSEQELRRIAPELLPAWVPDSKTHRPDGYSRVQTDKGARIYAFEAELTLKSKSRLADALDFYENDPSISAVFWLTGSPAIQNAIETVLGDGQFSRRSVHHFLSLQEFSEHGWMSVLNGGKFQGKRLADLLVYGNLTILLQKPYGSSCSLLLKKPKRPIIPNESQVAGVRVRAD